MACWKKWVSPERLPVARTREPETEREEVEPVAEREEAEPETETERVEVELGMEETEVVLELGMERAEA